MKHNVHYLAPGKARGFRLVPLAGGSPLPAPGCRQVARRCPRRARTQNPALELEPLWQRTVPYRSFAGIRSEVVVTFQAAHSRLLAASNGYRLYAAFYRQHQHW